MTARETIAQAYRERTSYCLEGKGPTPEAVADAVLAVLADGPTVVVPYGARLQVMWEDDGTMMLDGPSIQGHGQTYTLVERIGGDE